MIPTAELNQNFLPPFIPIFGDTRLEKNYRTITSFEARILIKVPFLGVISGEFLVWTDLDLNRLSASEKAHACGVLLEASNILAGVALSELADRLDGRIMLAPPKMIHSPGSAPSTGSDYQLHMLNGHCSCRVEILTGEDV